MKKNLKIGILAVLLISVIIGGAFWFNPSLLNNVTSNFNPDTTLSISQIFVDPQGYPVGDEYKGSFWNILVYVNANDELAGAILPKDQTGSVTYAGAIQALKTGAKVEIKINPEQPYIVRSLQEKTREVVPPVGQTYVSRFSPSDRGESFDKSASGIDLHFYDWSGAWRIYTPFTVTVFKDGQQIGQPITLNMEGSGNTVQNVPTPEGNIRIENLGSLTNQYIKPDMPTQIAIFKGYGNIYDLTQITNIIQYNQGASYQNYPMDSRLSTVSGISNTFCAYWYGSNFVWTSNKQPVGIKSYGTQPSTMIDSGSYGGWQSADDSYYFRRNPVSPAIGSSDKANLPSDKQQSFKSLIEFIESKGIQNLALTTFDTKAAGHSSAVWQKASFVTDTNGQTALRLDIPWNAFGTPLVSIRVPTELADTWIERPIVTSVDVSATWLSTGTKYCNLMGANRIAVTVTNKASVTGSTHLVITSANSKLQVEPLDMTVNNLAPNVPQTVYFDAANLGVESQKDKIPITITGYDTYTGSPSGSDTIYGTLLPTLQTGTTILKLYAVEKGTDNPIQGLQVQIVYPPDGSGETPTAFTDANGEISLTLSTPQGGAYTGAVYVHSADTPDYKAASATYTLNNPTAYEFTFEVERKDTTYKDDTGFSWTLIVGIVAAVCVIGGLGYYASKHTGKGKRRRR